MAKDSNEIGAQLYGLWRAGKISMPAIANRFVDANGKLNATQGNAEEAFTQVDDDVSQVYGAWQTLRDQAQTFTGNSGAHVHNLAEAIVDIMNEYKDNDDAAADKMDCLIQEAEANADGGTPNDPKDDLIMPDDVRDYTDPVFPKSQ